MNNGLKSGLLIIGISLLGIAFFLISGREMPNFFPRFLLVGAIVSALGVYGAYQDKKEKNDEKRLRK